MGSKLVTVTWKISAAVTEPESKPPLLCEHGSVALPCTAVWMLPTKWNSSTSFTFAVTVSGEKTKPPEPAVMTIVSATAVAARAAKRLIDACIAFENSRYLFQKNF